jgi:hypothetical protein
MANKRLIMLLILLCLLGALAALVVGVVFAVQAASSGVMPVALIICAVVAFGLCLLAGGGVFFYWYLVRHR